VVKFQPGLLKNFGGKGILPHF